MKIEKRGSSYRVRKMHEGKMINITFDHKPTNKEILKAIAEKISEKEVEKVKYYSFKDAAEEYNKTKENVLSPATMRDYVAYPNRLPKWFVDMSVHDIGQVELNRLVNELATPQKKKKAKSPKTIKNYHGYVASVLGVYRPELRITTKLPQAKKYKPYEPTKDDVKRIVEYVFEHEKIYIIPISLSVYGLRRSETCALLGTDVIGNTCYINKAKVLNKDKKWVIKITKTTDSEREVEIPGWLADMIREQGYAYNGHPNQILKCIQRTQEKLGLPKFTLHVMRHYFAAVLSEKYDEATVMSKGGWKSPYVMKHVYRYSLVAKDKTQNASVIKELDESFANLTDLS